MTWKPCVMCEAAPVAKSGGVRRGAALHGLKLTIVIHYAQKSSPDASLTAAATMRNFLSALHGLSVAHDAEHRES
jgi:hypothetical protein